MQTPRMPAPPPPPDLPKAALPRHAPKFDPWNSSSTGHQRPDRHPGTGWRDSRNRKLNTQLRAGGDGGPRMDDTWGPGAVGYSKELGGVVPAWVAERRGRSVADMLTRPGLMRESLGRSKDGEDRAPEGVTDEEARTEQRCKEDEQREMPRSRKLFDGVIVYVNGSTYPAVSDHRLKHLLSEHGAQMSVHLGRRRVTHVIIGRPAGGGKGAGGGLAGGKLEREIQRIGGCGVKYVDVEW